MITKPWPNSFSYTPEDFVAEKSMADHKSFNVGCEGVINIVRNAPMLANNYRCWPSASDQVLLPHISYKDSLISRASNL